MRSLDPTERRVRAGRLLDWVLDEAIAAPHALAQWPVPVTPPGEVPGDPSLEAAYQALWHFHSDEGARLASPYYLDAQLRLLRTMADTLSRAEPLSADILGAYRYATAAPRFYSAKGRWREPLDALTGKGVGMMRLFQSAWHLFSLQFFVDWLAGLWDESTTPDPDELDTDPVSLLYPASVRPAPIGGERAPKAPPAASASEPAKPILAFRALRYASPGPVATPDRPAPPMDADAAE